MNRPAVPVHDFPTIRRNTGQLNPAFRFSPENNVYIITEYRKNTKKNYFFSLSRLFA